MHEAKEDVLAHSCGEDFVYRHFPKDHWRKIWSTNLLERLVGAVLLEQHEHWQLEGRR